MPFHTTYHSQPQSSLPRHQNHTGLPPLPQPYNNAPTRTTTHHTIFSRSNTILHHPASSDTTSRYNIPFNITTFTTQRHHSQKYTPYSATLHHSATTQQRLPPFTAQNHLASSRTPQYSNSSETTQHRTAESRTKTELSRIASQRRAELSNSSHH